jgi:hypothetical protein
MRQGPHDTALATTTTTGMITTGHHVIRAQKTTVGLEHHLSIMAGMFENHPETGTLLDATDRRLMTTLHAEGIAR